MARRIQTKKQLERDLGKAKHAKRTVRVQRIFGPGSDIDGLVLDFSKRWVVLAPVGGGPLDGYNIVRRNTVQSIEAAPSERFHRKAIARSGGLPPKSVTKRLDLGRTRDLIASVAASSPLVTLHNEYDWPDECYIGVPDGYGKHHVKLREVTSRATWDELPNRYWYADVTRVDFGAHYEGWLHRVAGKPPKR